jgi:hypothetical protein
MLLAGESTQISKENQDGWPAAQVLHAVSLTVKVGEAESGCWQAGADGHGGFQPTADVTANTDVMTDVS